jgi:hypothetical protein
MKIFMWTASFMYVLVEAVFPLNTFLFPSALLIIRYPGTSVSRRHCPSILGSLVFGGNVSPAVALLAGGTICSLAPYTSAVWQIELLDERACLRTVPQVSITQKDFREKTCRRL